MCGLEALFHIMVQLWSAHSQSVYTCYLQDIQALPCPALPPLLPCHTEPGHLVIEHITM